MVHNGPGSDGWATSSDDAQRLRSLTALLAESQRIAALGNWETEVATGATVWSDEQFRILGFEPGSVTPGFDAVFSLVHPEDRERFVARNRQVREVDGFVEHEYRIVRPDGSERVIHSRLHALRDAEGGTPRRIAGIIQDVTAQAAAEHQREQLQHDLAQARRMESIGLLAGGIAHEFNNLLAIILGYTGLARGEHFAGDHRRLEQRLHEVDAAGGRARDLVAKLLSFSRVAPAESGVTGIAATVTEICELLHATLPSTIKLAARIEAPVDQHTEVPMASGTLHQVLMNLCINARDAMPDGGRVTVSVRRTELAHGTCISCAAPVAGTWTELAVADGGGGIDAAEAARLFEPFFTTKEVGHGTGLGLAIVHGAVHDSGGHLLVASTPGHGSTFRVLLPSPRAIIAPPPAATTAMDPVDESPALGVRVLLADDEPAIREFIAEMLTAGGCSVHACADGRTALELFERDPSAIDVVVTDQSMPGMTGGELARAMLARRPDLPVILCSGFSEQIDERSAAALGIRRYLAKPYDAAILLTAIAELRARADDEPPAAADCTRRQQD